MRPTAESHNKTRLYEIVSLGVIIFICIGCAVTYDLKINGSDVTFAVCLVLMSMFYK